MKKPQSPAQPENPDDAFWKNHEREVHDNLHFVNYLRIAAQDLYQFGDQEDWDTGRHIGALNFAAAVFENFDTSARDYRLAFMADGENYDGDKILQFAIGMYEEETARQMVEAGVNNDVIKTLNTTFAVNISDALLLRAHEATDILARVRVKAMRPSLSPSGVVGGL